MFSESIEGTKVNLGSRRRGNSSQRHRIGPGARRLNLIAEEKFTAVQLEAISLSLSHMFLRIS